MEYKDQTIIIGGKKANRHVRNASTQYDKHGAYEAGEATYSGETIRVRRYKVWPAQAHLASEEWYKEGETPNLSD